MVPAAEVPAAVAAAIVAEDGLAAAGWSCLPIKDYVLQKCLSFLAKTPKLFLKVIVQHVVVVISGRAFARLSSATLLQ